MGNTGATNFYDMPVDAGIKHREMRRVFVKKKSRDLGWEKK